MSVAILVPVLGRPHRVVPLLASIAAATPQPYRVLFICDRADVAQRSAVCSAGAVTLNVNGNYAAKINAGVAYTHEPLLFFGADDVHFHPGWLAAAEAHMSDSVGVVGTQDMCNPRTVRGEHATHFLVARWYAQLPTIDDKGGPLCELYPHEFVDDEFVATAKHRGAWAFAEGAVVEHLHPDVGKAPSDALYEQRPLRMRRGRRIFRARSHLWT